MSGVWQVTYSFCFNVQALSADVATMTVRRVDYTLLDAEGQVYRSFSDTTSNVGRVISETFGGCIKFLELDVVRAVSPRFRATIEFFDLTSSSYTRSFDGTVTNNVPPWPFIDTVTLVVDITGQPIVREHRPLTFTVTQVTGGVPPFLYLFKINGFVMRDWGADPFWVWDTQTLNNTPTVNGGYTCSVNVRRSSFALSEQTASTSFTLLFSEAADKSRLFPLAQGFARGLSAEARRAKAELAAR